MASDRCICEPAQMRLRCPRLLLTTVAIIALAAAPARAGPPITKLPECENSYLYYADGVSRPEYRAALLCLINGARKAQRLPPLRRSAQLEAVAQSQSDRSAATGRASHGKSLTDITKRFARRGYRAAAYDEAFALLIAGASPYAFLAELTRAAGIPCTQIFDPRFRDAGIGVAIGFDGRANMLTVELGRKAGTRQPSADTRPAATCGHRIPKPAITGPAIEGRGLPVATDTTVTIELACVARTACALTAALTLPGARAEAPAQSLTIEPGQQQALTFALDAAAISAERASAQPRLSLNVTVTAPAQYSTTLTAPLPG